MEHCATLQGAWGPDRECLSCLWYTAKYEKVKEKEHLFQMMLHWEGHFGT